MFVFWEFICSFFGRISTTICIRFYLTFTSELKTLSKALPMLGPNATSRKNEMTSGTFGFVSLAQQLPSKPAKDTGMVKNLHLNWLQTTINVCLCRNQSWFSSRLQAGQSRRRVWESEGYNLPSPHWNIVNGAAKRWGGGGRLPLCPLVPTALKGHMRASWTEQPASLAWHHAHSQWCGDVHHDRIARDQCQVKNVTQTLTSINKINQLWV